MKNFQLKKECEELSCFFPKNIVDNIHLNIRELKERKKILKSYPFKIYVEPTQRCNLDCIMCAKSRRSEKKDMSISLFKKIEHDLFPLAAEVDFFLTGEPVLSPLFIDMIKTSKKYHFLPKIFTNANALSKKLKETLVQEGIFVNISMDAATPWLYETIRRGSNWNNYIKNIKDLVTIQEKIKNPRFHIRLACTLGSFNIQEAPKIILIAKDLGIKDVMFGAMDILIYSEKHLTYDIEKSIYYLKLAKKLADENKIRFSCPKRIGGKIIDKNHNWNDFSLPIDKFAPFLLEEFNPYNNDCGYPWIQTVIRSNGLVVSCCQREHIMGDLNKNSFQKIWNNDKYQKIRSQKDYSKCIDGHCNLAIYSIWKGEKICRN